MSTTTTLKQDNYHISLATFKGPLDLLLFLIRRAEVDISDIPITEITEQYVAMLSQIESIDIDLAGEFLVMAATLVEIKSRVLQKERDKRRGEGKFANDETSESLNIDAADPRYELVQQLLAYQKYRMAAEELDDRRDAFALRFPVTPGRRVEADTEDTSIEPVEIDIEDAHAFDLFEAYERIVESIDFSKLGEHEVEADDTPIGLHQDDLIDRLTRVEGPRKRLTLQQAWLGRRKIDVIGLFMATLELVKQRRILVVQEEVHGEIMLELNSDPEVVLLDDDDEEDNDVAIHDQV